MPPVVVGEEYGYREPPVYLTDPMRRALLVKLGPARLKHKVLVRWLDGEWKGLEEWVSKTRLECPWREVPDVLEDERRLAEVVNTSPDEREMVQRLAAELAITAITSRSMRPMASHLSFGWNVLDENTIRWADILRDAPNAGLDPQERLGEPRAFIDRKGEYHAPYATGLRLARLF